MKRILSIVLAAMLIASLFTVAANALTQTDTPDSTFVLSDASADETVPSTDDEGISTLPQKPEGTNRYFFYMPEESWVDKNPYTVSAGIYWWEGTDACAWPGYEAKSAGYENVYYYDVPLDVTSIIWTNLVDGGLDSQADIFIYDYRTVILNTEYYDTHESGFYPNGTDSFDNMIYVLDLSKTEVNEYTGKSTFSGEWFYYYGNGEYGLAKNKADAKVVLTGDNVDLSELQPEEEATEPTEATTPTEPVTTPAPTTPEVDDSDTNEKPEGTNRYFFYVPEVWTANNPYSISAGIYWWEGTDACDYWPGYQAKYTGINGIYYYDVPGDVTAIIWNNAIDGGTDSDADIYSFAYKTKSIGTEYYDIHESRFYPDGTDNFDNMIYIVDVENIDYNDFAYRGRYEGEWFYYYGNGEYGLAKEKADAKAVYTADTLNLDKVYEGEFAADPPEVPEVTAPSSAPDIEVTEPTEVTKPAEPTTDVPESIVTEPSEASTPTTEATTAEATATENKTEPTDGYQGVLGDVNGDGKVNIKDATLIQKYAAKLEELSEPQQIVADVNADGKVNVKDATAIQKYVAKIETGLPIGKPVA